MSDASGFDYVVVGAGAAGAVLAARLSENPSTRVLLVEAGPDLRWADCPPAMHAANPMPILQDPANAQFAWADLTAARTIAQPHLPFWRGRGLGGSTAINGMFAVRGDPGDHDDWAAAGCKGWAWDDVLPWFCRLEDDVDFGDRDYHGTSGPYAVWRPPQDTWGAVDKAVRDAALAIGYPWCDDHNAPTGTGVSPYAASVRDGERVSTNDAYLEPARDRDNLTIRGSALVDRLRIEGGRAVAVEYLSKGERVVVEGGEVLVAGGAVHSPAILMRSGIGPPAHLEDLGIDVVTALAGVGANLSDHAVVMMAIVGPNDDSWMAPNGRHGSCYIRYSSSLAGTGDNDMAFFSAAYPAGVVPGMPSYGLVGPGVWQPFSRGRLRLASPDPAQDPVVDENMLSDPRDVERMRGGLRRALELFDHPAMRSLSEMKVVGRVADFAMEPLADDPSDEELDRLAQQYAGDLQHIVGTCRMGDADDPATVVDASGHVLGVDGLRVIDASIIPACPRANTALTTIMLAEKLAGEMTGSAPQG